MSKPSTLWQQFWDWTAPDLPEGVAEYTLAAKILHPVLIGVLIWVVFYFAIGLPFFVVRKSAATALVVLITSAALASLFYLRQGRVRLSSWIFLTTTWSILSILTILSGGFSSPALACFLAITVMATWLLGRRIALALGGVLLATAMALAILVRVGHHLPIYFPAPPMAGWVVLSFAVALTILPLNEVLRTIRESLERAQQQVVRLEQAEQALKKSEAKLRALFEGSSYPTGLSKDGISIMVNPAYIELFGYSKSSEVIGNPLFHDIAPAERSRIQEFANRRSKGEPCPSSYETHGIRRDGTIFDMAVGVSTYKLDDEVYTIGILRDVTTQKKAEKELKLSRQRLALHVEQTPLAVIEFDVDGRVREWNPAAAKEFGYLREEAIGQHWTFIVPEEAHPHISGVWESIVLKGGGTRSTNENRTKNGQRIICEWFNTPLIDQDKKTIGVASLVMNITERKQAEEEKAKLLCQLQQAQKMESVGRLAGGVAHDFNNMLGVILGHAEMALEEVNPAQPLHNDLMEIQKAANRSADLTRQLLAFARKQTVAPRVLDLNETIAGMLKMLERMIGESIILNWQPAENLWPIKVDPSQLDQILANLCVNSRDAIADVGRITLMTGNCTLGKEYCDAHVGLEPGEYVMLAVSDDGCGIDKEILGHIFEPFFTTKEAGLGTGLGLATVYGAVKQNKGFINVDSNPGHGTTVTIYLPRHKDMARQAQAEEAGPPIRGQETILLVEDEPAILKLATAILKRQGYMVLAASTPGEAIRLAKEPGGEIDLLVTDVIMPEMNGQDLAKQLLSLYPNLKCLFMSGYTADVIAHHGVLDESVCFIQKPFSAHNLIEKVLEALGRVNKPKS